MYFFVVFFVVVNIGVGLVDIIYIMCIYKYDMTSVNYI